MTIGTTDANNLQLETNNTTRVFISSSGNVGIGTTDANTLLVARKAVNDEWIAKFINTGTNPYGMYVDTSANTSGAYTFAAYTYGGTGLFVINNSGYVGIGSTAPTSQLELYLNIPKITLTPSGYTGNYRTILGARSNAEGVLQFGNNGSNYIAAGNTAAGGALYFYTNCSSDFVTSTNGTVALGLFSSGNASFYQNVGIGTTGPQAKLDVGYWSYNSANRSLYVRNSAGSINSNSYDTMVIQQDDVTSLRIVERNVSGTDQVMALSIGDGVARIAVTAQPLQLMVNGSASGISYQGLSGTLAVNIATSGNVGIRTTTVSYELDVAGNVRATADVIAYSDARVKENVKTVEKALDKVNLLRGVTYTRKDIDDKSEKIGVIAQEVLPILPQVVQQDNEGQYSVAYGNMAGLFIESIKELKAQNDTLQSRIQQLESLLLSK